VDSPLQEIKKTYEKRLLLREDDKLSVDYVTALQVAVLCNSFMEDPAWGYVIGPASGGKTESVRPLEGYRHALFRDAFTENALASGSRTEEGDDPSLLKVLPDKLLIMGDLTAFIMGDPKRVDKILGEFRRCYDGTFIKSSGKEGATVYQAKFGICAATTEVIDSFNEKHQQCGERFVAFRMARSKLSHTDRLAKSKWIREAAEGKREWRMEMAVETQAQLQKVEEYLAKGQKYPTTTTEIGDSLDIICDVLVLARTSCIEQTAATAEDPGRFVLQMKNLGAARIIADGRSSWEQQDLDFIKRIVIDTLNLPRRRLLWRMFQRGMHKKRNLATSIPVLAERCNTTRDVLEPILRQWIATDLVTPISDGRDEPLYKLSDPIHDYIRGTKLLEGDHMPKGGAI